MVRELGLCQVVLLVQLTATEVVHVTAEWHIFWRRPYIQRTSRYKLLQKQRATRDAQSRLGGLH